MPQSTLNSSSKHRLNVNQALRLLYADSCRTFLRALAGVILLGTPHSSKDKGSRWQTVGKVVPSLSKKQRSLSTSDIASLTNSSRQFEQAAVEVPILSVYETKETKVKTGLVTSKKILVSGKHTGGGTRPPSSVY